MPGNPSTGNGDWFEQGVTEDVVRLLIHEFGHEYSGDHLSAQYHEALCRIGAKMYALARQNQLGLDVSEQPVV